MVSLSIKKRLKNCPVGWNNFKIHLQLCRSLSHTRPPSKPKRDNPMYTMNLLPPFVAFKLCVLLLLMAATQSHVHANYLDYVFDTAPQQNRRTRGVSGSRGESVKHDSSRLPTSSFSNVHVRICRSMVSHREKSMGASTHISPCFLLSLSSGSINLALQTIDNLLIDGVGVVI
jgi:hypothetical protein